MDVEKGTAKFTSKTTTSICSPLNCFYFSEASGCKLVLFSVYKNVRLALPPVKMETSRAIVANNMASCITTELWRCSLQVI